MAGARFEPNNVDLAALLKGPEVIGLLEEIGDKVTEAAGGEPDYESGLWVGRTRARVTVSTATPAAAVREARDHVLLRALGSVSNG